MYKLLFAAVAVALAVAACGDSGGGSDAVNVPEGGGPDTSAAVDPTETDEPVEPDDDVRQDIADTIEGFGEALFGGEVVKLSTYWSQECTAEEIEDANGGALFAAGFVGDGEVDVTVDIDTFVMEQISDDRVLIPSTQPDGAIEILIDGRPLRSDEDEEDVILVLEDGFWQVANCKGFAIEFGS